MAVPKKTKTPVKKASEAKKPVAKKTAPKQVAQATPKKSMMDKIGDSLDSFQKKVSPATWNIKHMADKK